jgi:hypothetical protein
MRYREIVEALTPAQEVWKQTQKSHEALRKLRSKQADAGDQRASASSLTAGPERTRRLKAAARHDADAKSTYGRALSDANSARSRALLKATNEKE